MPPLWHADVDLSTFDAVLAPDFAASLPLVKAGLCFSLPLAAGPAPCVTVSAALSNSLSSDPGLMLSESLMAPVAAVSGSVAVLLYTWDLAAASASGEGFASLPEGRTLQGMLDTTGCASKENSTALFSDRLAQ